MFEAACESEGAQLEQMASFIEASASSLSGGQAMDRLRARLQRARREAQSLRCAACARLRQMEASRRKARDEWTARDLRRAGSRTIKGADAVKTGLAAPPRQSLAQAPSSRRRRHGEPGERRREHSVQCAAIDSRRIAMAQAHCRRWRLASQARRLASPSGASGRRQQRCAARVDDARSGANARI